MVFFRTHFLACEGVAAGSQQSGGRIIFFARTHFLACEGVAGGSQQSGGESFFFGRTSLRGICSWWVPVVRGVNRFFSDALPCVQRCSSWVPAVRGRIIFFAKYGGPSGGSPLLGGGIVILRVIRRHFLTAGVDLAVSLSTYSTLPMQVGR